MKTNIRQIMIGSIGLLAILISIGVYLISQSKPSVNPNNDTIAMDTTTSETASDTNPNIEPSSKPSTMNNPWNNIDKEISPATATQGSSSTQSSSSIESSQVSKSSLAISSTATNITKNESKDNKVNNKTETGKIYGLIGKVFDYNKQIVVCAQEINTKAKICNNPNDKSTFDMIVPVGQYNVWAYPNSNLDQKALFTNTIQCMPSKLSFDKDKYNECKTKNPDSKPTQINVIKNKTIINVRPWDRI